MYNERRVKRSELLQLLLLDNLYAQSGSEYVIFQGGTALRWVYGGMRFSEDLDFVTNLQKRNVEKIMSATFQQTQRACVAQFGPGVLEFKRAGKRKQATKVFCIYRPGGERERIAVKLEFERLKESYQPKFGRFILRDLPLVSGLVTNGELIMPYSSSIILVETLAEILSDKVRAVYERTYLKGRDIYDIWWLTYQQKVTAEWANVRRKLGMYEAPFVPVREADYFQKRKSQRFIIEALERDLPRFLPQNVFSVYREEAFEGFVAALRGVTSDLSDQGMKECFRHYERSKRHS